MLTTKIDVAVAVIRHDADVLNDAVLNDAVLNDASSNAVNNNTSWFLLGHRHATQDQGDCHEFVGGKIEPSETATDALIREVQEEIGLDIRQNKLTKLGEIEHDYPNKCVRLHVYEVRLSAEQYHEFNQSVTQTQVNNKNGQPALLGRLGQPLVWASWQELLGGRYRLPDANAQILTWLSAWHQA